MKYDPEKTAGGTGDALAKTDTGTTTPPPAPVTPPPAPAATTKTSDAEPSDDNEDWISNHAGLTDNQKKFVKSKITQNVNLREKVRNLEAEKNEREAAEAEAQRQKD